ncbi:hypothetical protein [Paenibacillus cremeus]|uniref:Uncharacterized protein n=1 Tax=Paenibacillus cremeus TaxID=2163881 RepID=A0A559JER8_9BACL|nr:hypothetical protein [Paenibacillus cremeus]TVX98368.1 hypothetical protein FPZ49_34570 [Paenibacillus cremeus]
MRGNGGMTKERLLTDIWNDIEKGNPVTRVEANRLKSYLDRSSAADEFEGEMINWALVNVI